MIDEHDAPQAPDEKPETIEVDDLVQTLLAKAANHEREAIAQQGAAASLRELAQRIQEGRE